eukprot:1036684-Prymnesium_polylepis.1
MASKVTPTGDVHQYIERLRHDSPAELYGPSRLQLYCYVGAPSGVLRTYGSGECAFHIEGCAFHIGGEPRAP